MSQTTTSPSSTSGSKQGMGWKIATIVLAITTVLALGWGIVRGNDLQSQVDDLNTTVAEQSKSSQSAAQVSDSQIADLEAQVAVLSESLKSLEKLSTSTLKAAASEYSNLESQLQASEEAVASLKTEQANTEATASQIGDAYQAASKELLKTQQALADVVTAISEEEATS
jgi:predicted metalloprotease